MLLACIDMQAQVGVAAGFLRREGAKVRTDRLYVVTMTPEVVVYEDLVAGAFAIVVRDEYADAIGNRVLAYSTDSRFQGMESRWKRELLGYYGEQLRWLKEHKVEIHDGMGPFIHGYHADIAPLIKTRWGQGYPYNLRCPEKSDGNGRALTGCVSTAMTQLMAYYGGMERPHGSLTVGNMGLCFDIDFANVPMNWAKTRERYTTETGCEEITNLMMVNSIALSADFTDNMTSANMRNLRTVLVNLWGYSAEARCLKCTVPSEAMPLINEDIEAGRPVFLAGGHHCFLCDGRKGDYLHLNLGWNGNANGYYRLSLVSKSAERNLENNFIKEVLCNVHPDAEHSTLSHKSIHVTTPGTLLLQLTDAELHTLQSLKVSGKLNSADMRILRRMAGAADEHYRPGILVSLDLSEARFVTDETGSFYTMTARGCRYTWTDKSYDFSHDMDERSFHSFLSTPVSSGDGYRFEQSIGYSKLANGPYSIAFHTVKDAIAPLQFFDCQNLRHLVLPKTTKRIYGKAFQWCNSLTKITIPSLVTQIESGAFAQCYLLQEVQLERLPVETSHKFAPTKVEGRYGFTRDDKHLGLFFGNSTFTCRGLVMHGQPVKSVEYKNMM